MKKHLALFTILLFSATANAGDFTPPSSLTGQDGVIYTLAYSQETENNGGLWEYTPPGETIDDWNSLMTIRYAPGRVDSMAWARSMKVSLDSNNPRPLYNIYLHQGDVFARFLLAPNKQDPFYESNVHRAYINTGCDGLVLVQHAVRYLPGDDTSASGKKAVSDIIIADNQIVAHWLEKYDWKPSCGERI